MIQNTLLKVLIRFSALLLALHTAGSPALDPAPSDVTLVITAAGDCTLGSDEGQSRELAFNTLYREIGSDPDYFLANVRDIFQKDDLTLVNLETTLSDRGSRTPDKKWCFRGLPEYIRILSGSGVEAATFSNNHKKDYGESSYLDTVAALQEAGIARAEEDTVALLEIRGVKVGILSIQAAFRGGNTEADYEYPDTDYLKQLTRRYTDSLKEKGAALILACFHWGFENTDYISPQQKALGHYAVDCGADLVIGTHPHVLQGIECYRGCYILYSLGNFCYGGHTNPSDKDTVLWQQSFHFENGTLIGSESARAIPCFISSVSSRNDYRPTPAAGNDAARILDRLNRLSAPFGVSFNGEGRR